VTEIADLQADLIILGHTQQTKQNVGSKATEVERVGVRSQTAKAIFARIAATLTSQFVRAVCFKNFGNYDHLPEIRCEMPDASVTGDEITGLETLQRMGLPIAAEWVQDRFGIPALRPGQEALKAVEPPAPKGGQNGAQSKVKSAQAGEGQKVSLFALLREANEILLASTISDAMSRIEETANA
jgi:phage gp29-like protein